ncbi:hypothetical protein [Montanilutibacter psychrotolerans]|uniref:Uncharacterized protein n=1 Tax=Montanilutibacter psychrotolerans TaxID=1327343 RepID=A0A3M8SKQ9_9GAMM|nr:hypothetical protein [Lysobacter psychrotolerans]RNF81891.1 hypothetical protein EER27_15745 [Lysobacter psychrotolerans]
MARNRNKGKSTSRAAPVQTHRKRSISAPLVIAGLAAVVAFPIFRDATGEEMKRDRYGADQYSCQCDYGSRCEHADGGWVGPWYPADTGNGLSGTREWGECSQDTRGTNYRSGGYYGAGRSMLDYHSPVSRESGYRGGFGGSARIRSAVS